MGGFEQKNFGLPGSRLALLVSDSTVSASEMPKVIGADSVMGVVYALSGDRVEIVVEGEKPALEAVIANVRDAAGAGATLRERWQLPVGGYGDKIKFVELQPKMQATINLQCKNDGALDYISRHVQIEAVFNRGLKCTKERISKEQLVLHASGDSGRLKSFVRWCYQGPALGRPDEVNVDWKSL